MNKAKIIDWTIAIVVYSLLAATLAGIFIGVPYSIYQDTQRFNRDMVECKADGNPEYYCRSIIQGI